jgi:4-diphosphocytidyl-2-C-methyl-D-erythritol kinase
MTGTGACVFGAFDTYEQAERAANQMPEPWHWFIAERCNESPLLEKLRAMGVRRY